MEEYHETLNSSLSEDIVNLVCGHIDTQLLYKTINLQVQFLNSQLFFSILNYFGPTLLKFILNFKMIFDWVNHRTGGVVCALKDIVLHSGPRTLHSSAKVVFLDSLFLDFSILLPPLIINTAVTQLLTHLL